MVLGSTAHALTPLVVAPIGFDGIPVALLGRAKPLGIVLAALLFGALHAGGTGCSRTPDPLNLITVLQALIVLFVAAPALVKAIFQFRAARAARLQTEPGEGLVTSCRPWLSPTSPSAAGRRGLLDPAAARSASRWLALGLLAAVLFGALATDRQARFTLSDDAGGAALRSTARSARSCSASSRSPPARRCSPGVPQRWFSRRCSASGSSASCCRSCAGSLRRAGRAELHAAGQHHPPARFSLAMPLIFGALGGVLCERSGVVNVAIEGQFLIGRVRGAPGRQRHRQRLGGPGRRRDRRRVHLAAAGPFAIRYLVNQVVLGVVLNLFAVGITGFLFEQLMQPDARDVQQPPPAAATGRSRC